MFDTIQIKTRVYINPDVIEVFNPRKVTFFNEVTGGLATKYTIFDEEIPFITYNDSSQILTVQLSIPKFLYGNNVTFFNEADISVFFNKLQTKLGQLFNIHVRHEEWIIIRLDVSWNFQVGSNVRDYIQHLSKLKLPFKDTYSYNHDQTVEYKNKSSRIMFYDKHRQCKKTKEPQQIIEQSNGILRLEVKPSVSHLKKCSLTKKAVELLTKPFFMDVVKSVLKELKYPSDIPKLDLSWLIDNRDSISQVETYLGYQLLNQMFDESIIKQIYKPSTVANRRKLVKTISIPSGSILEPLTIDESKVS